MDKQKFIKTKAKLKAHHQQISKQHMRDMFDADPKRFKNFSIENGGLLLDYSKNRINQQTIDLLIQLAKSAKLTDWRDKMFSGEKINHTENRAVLHTALRNRSNSKVLVDGKDVMPKVNHVLERMGEISEQVRDGEWRGYTGKIITDIVNIGIGGSDLGPKFAVEALKPYRHKRLNFHFVSNIDSEHLHENLKNINADTSLFILASKTFTTAETITNANSAREWFIQETNTPSAVAKHFIAITSNQKKAKKFGIKPENIFEFWDWVGGRYSMWSAIGLSIMLSIGYDKFIEMLAGAHSMDQHFIEAPLDKNMPVILGLLRYWYGTFFGSGSHVILPYDHLLRSLPTYLQQVDMESNGKSVSRDGEKINYPTGSVMWGQGGINGQHAFYQLLHQGTRFITSDFIIALKSYNNIGQHREILYANCLAQAEALMSGRTKKETSEFLRAQNTNEATINKLTPYMTFDGNHPSSTIVMDIVDPYNFGALIALYEHRIFTQAVLLNINSFDQWGVEFGKTLAKVILPQLIGNKKLDRDSSTNALITRYRTFNKK